VAALSRAGVWSRGDAISVPAYPPVYPHVWIAFGRALVTSIDSGQRFGYALVDLEGAVAGLDVWAPDLNLDVEPDRLMRTCARDDGFVLLTQGSFSHSAPELIGPAVMTFVDLDGVPAPSETLAPYGATEVDLALGCQPTGASAIWRDGSAVMLGRWAK
jgi:hypothetical protein